MTKISKLTLSVALNACVLLGSTVLAVAAGADGHGEGGFPPFDVRHFFSQIVWLLLTFGALYFLMSRVTLPRIGRILEERHDRIARDLEEASQRRAESEAAQAAYEKALVEARGKANTIAGEARNRLSAESETNRKSLEATLATRLEEAERRIEATKTQALSHVRGIAVDTAQAIVSALVGTQPSTGDVEGAVDKALAAKPAA
ncbi:F0F1 ATP synthase subunit B [Aquabacter cavernae]|uniref:F0F1 ATP synthase subunit B n=1 Tax=Aquabacter cavernae TaxID=2496029 RepID=UPI000F8EDF4D|nr:F0F1 ATP synthase subunit B [Aquabacter cavernae]